MRKGAAAAGETDEVSRAFAAAFGAPSRARPQKNRAKVRLSMDGCSGDVGLLVGPGGGVPQPFSTGFRGILWNYILISAITRSALGLTFSRDSTEFIGVRES